MKKTLAIIIALVMTTTVIIPKPAAAAADSITISLPEDPSLKITLTGAGDDYAIFTDYGMCYIVSLSPSSTVTFDKNVDIGSMGMNVSSASAGQVLTLTELNGNYVYAPNMASYILFNDEASFSAYTPAGKLSDLSSGGGGNPPSIIPTPPPAAPANKTVSIKVSGLQEKWLKFDLAAIMGAFGGGYSAPGSMGYTYVLFFDHKGTVEFTENVTLTVFDMNFTQQTKNVKAGQSVDVSSISGYSVSFGGSSQDSIAFVDSTNPGNYANSVPDLPIKELPAFIKIIEVEAPFRIPAWAWITLVIVVFLIIVIVINIQAAKIRKKQAEINTTEE